MNPQKFDDFNLSKPILHAVRDEGYSEPTAIQLAAIPEILQGRDVVATAETGTGKTAAFCLPILEMLERRTTGGPLALILTPTRELAQQIDSSLRTYGRNLPFRSLSIVGGRSMVAQLSALKRKPDILVATPGRLLDLIRQKAVRLSQVRFLVLDEADRMLDMGFIHDVKTIVSEIPTTRQTLLFSATLSPEIAVLASSLLKNPVSLATSPTASVAANIDQKVLFVDQANKASLLVDILNGSGVQRALVFTRTKHRAERLARHLTRHGISADAMHSNRSQSRRQSSLAAFDKGQISVLVATDIVSRGIDVDGISHVINYELPNDAQNYVHRVGRTARAGAAGIALSFCDAGELLMLRGIESLIRLELTPLDEHAFHSGTVASLHEKRVGVPARGRWRSFRPRGRSGGRSAAR